MTAGVREAYDALAPYYDHLTGWHDSREWASTLERHALDAGLQGRRLLDVACGTGTSFEAFLERGYEVTACDVSPRMAAIAEAKADGRARVEVCDMRDLPVLGAFDLVLCLGDALNYLDGAEDLARTFAGVRRNLAVGGLLLCDVNTLATFRKLYTSLLVVPERECVTIVEGRGTAELPAGGCAEARIDALVRGGDGWWSRVRTVHRHRHHPEAVVRAALESARLEPVSVRGTTVGGRIERGHDDLRHSKALYLARRNAP